jgi:DNA invertase Pin-like site-specific DNA recombinase
MIHGYARVSTDDQNVDSQTRELKAFGCGRIVSEVGSGADQKRPVLAKLIADIKRDDTLVVVRIDRVARSLGHLLEVIKTLDDKGAKFKSLNDPIDTTIPTGMFMLQILGAVAQLERSLISERTKAGIRSAVAKGKRPGNPGLVSGDKAAIARASRAKRDAFEVRVSSRAHCWTPVVQLMRPKIPWDQIVRFLNVTDKATWTVPKLIRAARVEVGKGVLNEKIFDRTTPSKDHTDELLRAIFLICPSKTTKEIAAILEAMGERTPSGGRQWSENFLEYRRSLVSVPIVT